MTKKRTVTTYIILRRGRWHADARVVRKSQGRPRLKVGECAVKVTLSVPDEAFDPVLQGPSLAFDVEHTLRSTSVKVERSS